MASLGTTVIYNGVNPKQVAIITAIKDDTKVDLAVWEGEAFAPKTDVPRGDDGAGHTWQPIN